VICARLFAVLVLLAGCRASTDRARYLEGEPGTVTLVNDSEWTGFLPGCQAFQYERFAGDAWVEQAPDLVCVWEGVAVPVPPRSALAFGFVAREPGRWRLRFDAALGCEPGLPLSQAGCTSPLRIVSNEFEVRALDPSGCRVTGCSGEVCASEPLATICVFLPHYVCFRDAQCSAQEGPGPEPVCGWELTSELRECLARFGVPLETTH
jgi:hypothetical protein